MAYRFSPLLFAGTLFGLTMAMAILAGLVQGATGIAIPPVANAIVPVILACAREGVRYGKAEGAVPATDTAWALARTMGLWTAATFAAVGLVGVVLIAGPDALLQTRVAAQLLAFVGVLGAMAVFVGYQLVRAMARRQLPDGGR